MKRDSRRVCIILMILFYFALAIVAMQGGIISLNSYVIYVGEKHKTLILIGLVHEGDLEADAFVLSSEEKPIKCRSDLPAHARIMEKILFDRLLENDKNGNSKSIIPVALEKCELKKKHPGDNLFEDQLVINRDTCKNPLAARVPLMCADPRTSGDLLFRLWLLTGNISQGVKIFPDPLEAMVVDIQEYEKRLSQYDFRIYPLPDAGVFTFNFAPYLYVKQNISRYEKIVSVFESYIKQFGRNDLLIPELSNEKTKNDAFSKSTIQTSIVVINNTFLKNLKLWLAYYSLTRFCKQVEINEQVMRRSLETGMVEYLSNMSFFSTCAEQLLKQDVQAVVVCVGHGHTLAIGKMIQEVGGKLSSTPLGMLDTSRGKHPFLTPFQLRMFLSMALGLAVNKEDVIIFEEINSRKLVDASRCNWCRKKQSQGLLTCSCCKKVFYCGPECQKADWPNHKKKCSPAPRQKVDEKKDPSGKQ